jgi:translation elongation factor EF-Tu-like GTPase
MEYKEVAKMKVFDVFNITNRGTVLSGEIIEGEISSGNLFKLNVEGRELIYQINSVESFSTETKAIIGLLIRFENNPELSYLENATGQTIEILVTI